MANEQRAYFKQNPEIEGPVTLPIGKHTMTGMIYDPAGVLCFVSPVIDLDTPRSAGDVLIATWQHVMQTNPGCRIHMISCGDVSIWAAPDDKEAAA